MQHHIQNERLRLQTRSLGAEMTSLRDMHTGEEYIWQADPKIWQGHAPLLFPYCGRLFDNKLRANGQEYPGGCHGFARNSQFTPLPTQDGSLLYVLRASEETRAVYPYEFELWVQYTLQGSVMRQSVRVSNPGQPGGGALPFAVGFHPAFGLGHGAEGWELAFDCPESPREILTPGGYVSGEQRKLFENRSALPLADDMFLQDSICMSCLKSDSITLRHTSGKAVRVGIAGFAQVLLWGPTTMPLGFICIEPWHGLPDGPNTYEDFSQKRPLVLLEAGQQWQTELVLEVL